MVYTLSGFNYIQNQRLYLVSYHVSGIIYLYCLDWGIRFNDQIKIILGMWYFKSWQAQNFLQCSCHTCGGQF